MELIGTLVRNANKSIEKGGQWCYMETASAQIVLKISLDDYPLPVLWLLHEELLPHWATGDETDDHLFWEAARLQCQAADRLYVETAERLKALTRVNIQEFQ